MVTTDEERVSPSLHQPRRELPSQDSVTEQYGIPYENPIKKLTDTLYITE